MTDAAEQSRTVRAGSRTYFFDIKQTNQGDNYLVITESRFKGEDQARERQRITVFPDARIEFLGVMQKMLAEL